MKTLQRLWAWLRRDEFIDRTYRPGGDQRHPGKSYPLNSAAANAMHKRHTREHPLWCKLCRPDRDGMEVSLGI